jgi:hypothetical protein
MRHSDSQYCAEPCESDFKRMELRFVHYEGNGERFDEVTFSVLRGSKAGGCPIHVPSYCNAAAEECTLRPMVKPEQ